MPDSSSLNLDLQPQSPVVPPTGGDDTNNGGAPPVVLPDPPETAEQQIQRLQTENATLKASQDKATALESENFLLKTKAAAKESSVQTRVNNNAADIQRDRAVAAAGGLAKFNGIEPNVRCTLLGVPFAEKVSDDEVKQYFGRGSSAQSAQRLAANDPARYRNLRIIAIERGIL